ncbi:MAG: glutamine synthetase adenylyltransferase [Planctomicrobium sp.]|jgi:[glutamine synthetase] adenylyltransferase / [glutamine synthetase]-adenylyl-L-tyrosine phosphorylase|nr:glutamine synthetase adenylyltransferase [Planctomicrobium sp.]
MFEHHDAIALLDSNHGLETELLDKISFVGFVNPPEAICSLRDVIETHEDRLLLAEILPGLLYLLSETPDSDRSVRNFQKFFSRLEDRTAVLQNLANQPRSVEILIRLFVGSQFLTEILLRNPSYLDQLTQHKRLAEFKSREEFISDARDSIGSPDTMVELKKGLRQFQQWELLRIAACDTFGVMDLKTVTLQLSLLADAIVHVALRSVLRFNDLEASEFVVIAFGKLGGLELNYSSDIDLVFVCQDHSGKSARVAQKLIQVLADFTESGFLYRVDMRLRPWGSSGPLVSSVDSYIDYFSKHAQLWERQALLKARAIAGTYNLGEELLVRLRHDAFGVDPVAVRKNVRSMKDQIEANIEKQSRRSAEVKGGPGGIRDIEFLVQYLQFIHGDQIPRIRKVGTQEGLIALSDANLIHAQEFRVLSTAYLIFRTIEHSLQIMHNQPEYFLPETERELTYLARRLDFPDADHFLAQYEKHTDAVKEIFDRHIRLKSSSRGSLPEKPESDQPAEKESQSLKNLNIEHLEQQLNECRLVVVDAQSKDDGSFDVVTVGYDHVGDLPILCGMLLVYGFDVISGSAEILSQKTTNDQQRIFLNRFLVKSTGTTEQDIDNSFWSQFAAELNELYQLSANRELLDAQKKLIGRIAGTFHGFPDTTDPLLPVEITVEPDPDSSATILLIRSEDVPGFLFELTNAITVLGLSIERMTIQTEGNQAWDTLHVIDPKNDQQLDEIQRQRLRATVALVKHFTHLLPHSPNPEAALVHFRGFLGNLFEQANWIDQLETLQQPDVLVALAKLLGFSDFLWEDFLRLQHENLFPVVTDISGLQAPRSREQLANEIHDLLEKSPPEQCVETLNALKDRAMMRVDMRHILGLQTEFGMFSRELTSVAEAIVDAAVQLVSQELESKYGRPECVDGYPARMSVVALGKCGGCELGYASDIELMFLYDKDGTTNGPKRISNSDYYQRLVKGFQRTILTGQKKIFEIDLRLRPYGKAGSLAVSKETFENYFNPDGPAWPFERQALVKLRPIAGDQQFCAEIVRSRDEFIYTGLQFDLSAMRAMREKQIRQFVEPGTFHAKLSPGGLVDCEYFIQGLQLTYAHLAEDLRAPNTRGAMKALEKHGVLSHDQRIKLRDAYRFLRRLIDGMRMVRGDATDLTIPHHESEQFHFLAKRLGINSADLHAEIERQTCCVIDAIASFEELIQE